MNRGTRSPRKQLELLFTASKRGTPDDVEELVTENKSLDVNHIGDDGKSALYHAVFSHHSPIVSKLITHGADVNLKSFCTYHRDHSGVQLISCDEPPLVTAARVGNVQIVKILLEAGANPDSQADCHTQLSGISVRDRTALHFACDEINVECVRLLLDYNADVNMEDKQGELPLHRAARCRQCAAQTEILKLLCAHGSDIDLANRISCSPLYLAAFYNCVEKSEILLLYGADPNVVCTRGNSYGSALHIAAWKDRRALAEKLLSHGSDLNLRNKQDLTPVYLNICTFNKSTVATILINHGADLNGKDRYNYTLMAHCIRDMRLDCEILARHMVAAGYDLRQDLWLNPPWKQSAIQGENQEGHMGDNSEIPEVSIAPGRVEALCDWLRESQTNTLCLSDLCRIAIRRILSQHTEGRSIQSSILSLPLPPSIKDYVALKEFFPSNSSSGKQR